MAPAKRQAPARTGRGATKKIGGVDVPGDADLECDRYPPSELYPVSRPIDLYRFIRSEHIAHQILTLDQIYKSTPSKPLSDEEIIQVGRFLTLRRNIREGPFYTVLGDNVRAGKSAVSSAAAFDPFQGMATYSQKYMKKRRRIPKLDSRQYGQYGWFTKLLR